jgi:transcriptional regulator with XRE-family HTH domain
MNQQERDELAERVRQARKEKRYTQQQLAEGAGVSLGTINNLERGVSVPQRANLASILRFLGIDQDPGETRAGWDDDVELQLDIIGAFLQRLDPEHRRVVGRQFTEFILDHPK